ncbi:MAG: carbamoyl phosphate synthase [Chloroflexi bacterium]|nr:MAG: carbamoyl phosphate synthase [Chloroflexota bacterium]
MTRHHSPRVLFTSVGRRVELLRAFRRAYESLGLRSNVVALDMDPLAPALQIADKSYLVPRSDDAQFIPTLIDICRRERVSTIFPLIDPDILLLSRHEPEIEATGARIASVSYRAAVVTCDKWQTKSFFEDIGVPVPRTWLPSDLDPSSAPYPLFIKTRQGSASEHAYKTENERDLRFFLEYVPDPIVQEFLPGPEITLDVICDLDGEILSVVGRKRIDVRGGEVSKGVTIRDAGLIDICVKIAHQLLAKGPICVQCILKDGRPYFTEVNTRFGGGFPLALAAGVDAPRWLLARSAGIEVEIPPLGTFQEGLFLTRFDESYFLSGDDYERMGRHRI